MILIFDRAAYTGKFKFSFFLNHISHVQNENSATVAWKIYISYE